MKFQEFTPNTLLRPYINRYFTLVSEQYIEDTVQLHLPPNGTSGLLFQRGNFYSVTNRLHQMSNLPNVFVMGQPSECFKVELTGKFEIIGVHFTPVGLNRLFGIPIHELTDQGADADQLLGKSINQMGDRLWDLSENSLKVAELEVFLLKHLAGCKTEITTADHAVDSILRMEGKVEITTLAKQLKVSRRTLERQFLKSVGMYPKLYSQIARLNHFFKLARSQPDFCWHDLLYPCGYYDQSHFIRTFKSFMRHTPTQYWEKLKKHDILKNTVRLSCRGITAESGEYYSQETSILR